MNDSSGCTKVNFSRPSARLRSKQAVKDTGPRTQPVAGRQLGKDRWGVFFIPTFSGW